MLLHPLLLNSKVYVLEKMLSDPSLAFGDLPGAREASIQVAKLKKMAAQYSTRFPLEAIPVGHKKKSVDKAKGEFRRRLGKQNRGVDRHIVRVFEESLRRSGEKPSVVKRSRGAVQKIVEAANRSIYLHLDQRMLAASKGKVPLKRLKSL